MSDVFAGWMQLAIQLTPFVILLAVWFGIPILVYRDANRLGRNGGLWALLTFAIMQVALPIYLCVRKPKGDFTERRLYS